MKCSSCHTLAPIDSIFGGQLPPILPPGVRLVETHSLQSERRPTPSNFTPWSKVSGDPFHALTLMRNLYNHTQLRKEAELF